MKETTMRSKLEEQGLVCGELEHDNEEGGINLKLMQ
jgi:hypothetical protein